MTEWGVATLVVSVLVVCITLVFLVWRKRCEDGEGFRRVGTVSALYLYPVKSCAGIRVTEALADRHGLSVQGVRDRHWMVVAGETCTVIHQRKKPQLALVQPSISGGQLCLDAPNMSPLHLPCDPPPHNTHTVQCRMWDSTITGVDCGQEASEWFSQYLGKEGVRLVVFRPGTDQPRHLSHQTGERQLTCTPQDAAVFANLAPYLLLSTASVHLLNSKLPDTTVTVRNFRPNIYITGCPAHREDDLSEVCIGGARFRNVKLCDRCALTTVDPDTGTVNSNGEPLRTLKRTRSCHPSKVHLYGEKPFFGINLAPDECSVVREGDEIFATCKRKRDRISPFNK